MAKPDASDPLLALEIRDGQVVPTKAILEAKRALAWEFHKTQVARCRSKQSYRKNRQAKLEAIKKSARFGVKTRHYHCPICGLYHLTTLPKRTEGSST